MPRSSHQPRTSRAARVRELAASLCFSPSGLSHAVSRLERAGSVRRGVVAERGRRIDAVLTEQGHATLPGITEVPLEHADAVVRVLVAMTERAYLDATHRGDPLEEVTGTVTLVWLRSLALH